MRLTKKVSRDWFIDDLTEKGVAVEFWDVVSVLYGDVGIAAGNDADYMHLLRTYREVEERILLTDNKSALYVLLINYDGKSADLFRLLSKYKCRMLFIAWGAMPFTHTQRGWRQLIWGANPIRLIRQAYYKMKGIAYKKLRLVSPYEIVFAAGEVLMATHPDANKVVPFNLMDYEQFRKSMVNPGRKVKGNYAVFLDVNLPFHPDHKLVGWGSVNPGNYYASLNRFFSILEEKYNIKVVVAAHPTACYDDNIFAGREIYHGHTSELVKNADFVIAHHSTSLSYAVLNQKPLLFVFTDEIRVVYKHSVMNYLDTFADYLGAAIYNTDSIYRPDQITLPDVDVERYSDYKYNYLTTRETEHQQASEIFWREINEAMGKG